MKRLAYFIVFAFCASIVSAQGMSHGDVSIKPINALKSGTNVFGVGHSDIRITTSSDVARRLFDQGLAMYHCFYWVESHRIFRDCVKADPSCAMGWWGIYISLTNPWVDRGQHKAEAEDAMMKAIRLMENASPLEQDFIRATKIRSVDNFSSKSEKDFIREMVKITNEYPSEVEPRAFLAGIIIQTSLTAGYDRLGRPNETMAIARRMCQEALSLNKHHAGAHHYWIHAVEGSPKPEEALSSADLLGKIAWNSGHMIHMPGHIYYRSGLYDKAIEAFSNAVKVDEAYNKQVGSGSDNWNHPHNLAFLLAAMVEAGKRADAEALVAKYPMLDFGQIFIRYRFGEYKEALSLIQGHPVFSKEFPNSRKVYFEAMEAIRQKNIQEAEEQFDKLKDATKKSKDDDVSMRILMMEVEANIHILRGRKSEGVKTLNAINDLMSELPYEEPPSIIKPPQESIADSFAHMGDIAMARKALQGIGVFRRNGLNCKKYD